MKIAVAGTDYGDLSIITLLTQYNMVTSVDIISEKRGSDQPTQIAHSGRIYRKVSGREGYAVYYRKRVCDVNDITVQYGRRGCWFMAGKAILDLVLHTFRPGSASSVYFNNGLFRILVQSKIRGNLLFLIAYNRVRKIK